MRRTDEKRTDLRLWRTLGYYLVLTCAAGIALGVLGNAMAWSGGTSFVMTALVGTPIALMALRSTLACLEARDYRPGRRRRSPPEP